MNFFFSFLFALVREPRSVITPSPSGHAPTSRRSRRRPSCFKLALLPASLSCGKHLGSPARQTARGGKSYRWTSQSRLPLGVLDRVQTAECIYHVSWVVTRPESGFWNRFACEWRTVSTTCKRIVRSKLSLRVYTGLHAKSDDDQQFGSQSPW